MGAITVIDPERKRAQITVHISTPNSQITLKGTVILFLLDIYYKNGDMTVTERVDW
jgi:hypothetical protein